MSETYSIGVDLGGTNLRVASYTGGIDFMDSVLLPTRLREGPDRVVRDMCDAIKALAVKDNGGRRLAGIGIGSPGPMQLPQGVLRNPPNLPGWDLFELRKAIESELGTSVAIECDANLAALAEEQLGAGRMHGVDSLCVLTLGTGVGSGFVLNGRILHGATGMGGEAGHVIVQDVGVAACGCGGFGCLEQYASASAVVRMAQETMSEEAPATAHGVALSARSGDLRATSVFEGVGHALGIALTGLINTLNLPLYLLGGGVCDAWDLLAPTLFSTLHRRSYVYRLTEPDVLEPLSLEVNKTYVLRAQLGSSAGLLGACLLPYQTEIHTTGLTEDMFAHQ
jgi:glucokinase